ncbi:MAG: hypothetical protein JWP12_1379 [Bacteroidetes bacterium]|nr:hypothetical protein [Bacteroidota bacterium]
MQAFFVQVCGVSVFVNIIKKGFSDIFFNEYEELCTNSE